MAANLFNIVKDLPPWVMLGLGVVTGGLRAVWSFLYAHTVGYAITRVSISLTVEDSEHRDAYSWLSCWVEQHLRGRKVNSLLLRPKPQLEVESDERPGFEIIPEYGTYYLVYKRRLMVVEHRKESDANGHQRRPTHLIRLQIWLAWDRTLLLGILQAAENQYQESRAKRLEYFRSDGFGDWTGSTTPARAIASIFHPPSLIRELLEDLRKFLQSKQMYHNLGIPYRRGYLLAGPPGTGKSSLILAAASHFHLPIYAVPLRGKDISGERLAAMLNACRKPSLLAFEDIDCLKVATTRDSKVNDGLTMADLLNVIDGIGASEDRILFMTANHPESLDSALTRAGRVDRKFYVDYARDNELRAFHQRVSEYQPVPTWSEFRASLPKQATIADAQALATRAWNDVTIA